MVTYEELQKIARLAKLTLTDEDAGELMAQMEDIFSIGKAINDVDLSQFDCSAVCESATLREDILAPSLPVDEILQGAPEIQRGYFAVPTGGGR